MGFMNKKVLVISILFFYSPNINVIKNGRNMQEHMRTKLTAIEVRSVKNPGFYRAGVTLYLNIAPAGSKSWIQRIIIHGKRRNIGLGGYPLVSLAEARDQAFQNRKLARSGGDPLAEKRKIKLPTFEQAAEKTFKLNRARWRSEKTAKNWEQGMKKHILPVIGELRVDQIGREEVLHILTPIWTTTPEIARKQRNRIRAVLSWCQAHGFIEHNVAGEMIDGALPAMPAVKEHYRALPYQEVPAALETVDASTASLAAKLCFRFLVLTATRSGEARGATWSEIDFDAKEWCIPASRMKAGVEHRVPLSDPALTVLEQAQILRDGSDLVFPSSVKSGTTMSNMTLTKVLRTTGLAKFTTIHGLRSAFRDYASENTNAAHAVMELSLAHKIGSAVERAYARSDLLAKRRRLMEQWASYIAGDNAEVVQLHG